MLAKKQRIDTYIVTFPIKEGDYAETYRVKDNAGKNYFLKLIDLTKLHHTQFDDNGNVLEIEIAKQLDHTNITKYHDDGNIVIAGKRYVYVVFDFIAGETVAEKVTREQKCSVHDAKQILLGVLNGLRFLHGMKRPIVHNELTIQNIMVDMSDYSLTPKIIDFGYARYADQSTSSYNKSGLNPFYQAPEALSGVFSVQSDLFSVGVMLYHLLFGILPFYTDLSKYSDDRNAMIDAILQAKSKPLKLPSASLLEMDEQLINIMEKSMAMNVEDRFQSAEEFMKALTGEIKVDRIGQKKSIGNSVSQVDSVQANRKVGNGFKDVAGMTKLKEQLQSDVIEIIKNPDRAKEFGLTIPNGLLFYGPPGCGKTFFAEKFAEEAGFNYRYVKCSDVASPFIHGGQDKIAAIFDEARKNAPTILFFDEIDAMIKDRSKHTNVSESGEVNEFLAQLNNCGNDGVLVIGATNKPQEIDEAALRAGRLEFKYYIPLPDAETRAKIFEINLMKRKCELGIDYDKLASLTENYISADIKLIVDNAARLAFRRRNEKISQAIVEEIISESTPSLTQEMIKRHESIRDEFSGTKKTTERRKIGFQ